MTKIKIVYFDSVATDSVTFENRLRSVCSSIFMIKDGLVLVKFDGGAQDLFEKIMSNDDRYNILVVDLDTSPNSYWGYMSRDLWAWLSENM